MHAQGKTQKRHKKTLSYNLGLVLGTEIAYNNKNIHEQTKNKREQTLVKGENLIF